MKPIRSQEKVARRIAITGVVQGVGFRPFVYNLARASALAGWVLNHSGGVDIEVEGPEAAVTAFITDLEKRAPPLSHIESLDADIVPPQDYQTFEIRHSESQEGRYQLISPDVATCPDCLRELLDPNDRRYRYPFTNCTNCGPRFTIIEDIPYDRPKTTMRVFPMCPDCQAEYEDPVNRRFHAQPNACTVCGPRVWLVGGTGESADERESDKANQRISESARTPSIVGKGIRNPTSRLQHPGSGLPDPEDVFAQARTLLLAGKIIAIKGLGGFQLACDATNAEAVARLRERKRRPGKPFAIMIPTVEDARALCHMPPEAETLLMSPQCPIVLLDARPGAHIADNVAPNSHTLGVMLPYTPLHHILLRDIGRPLVMTSGNVSEEPIAKDNDEALRRLSPLADAFLLHNRDIHARYDDSVLQIVKWANGRIDMATNQRTSESANEQGQQRASNHLPAPAITRPASNIQLPGSRPQFLRRARGYAPFPVRLPFKAIQVYAAGPLLKNTFTLTRDEYAFVSQHIGDLENLETLEHYQAALNTYQHLFRIEPEIVVSDLHPDYMSTRLADAYARERGLPTPLRVQHHKAHIASCLADNGWNPEAGPVIGVAMDGTGYGEDGHIWGGEWFIGDYSGFERAAHLEYLPLPGGDAAIRHPWRSAVAYLHVLEADESLPLGEFCPADVMQVRTLVDHRLNTPLTSSMGRLFDAVSALLGVCHEATYEAQAAIELEQVVPVEGVLDTPESRSPYRYEIDSVTTPYRVRVGSLFEDILADQEYAVPVPEISLRFHATVAEMITSVSSLLRQRTGVATVALSGGVFQNRLLLALALPRLAEAGFEVLTHQQVPPNDGGVSLGQAAVASLRSTE